MFCTWVGTDLELPGQYNIWEIQWGRAVAITLGEQKQLLGYQTHGFPKPTIHLGWICHHTPGRAFLDPSWFLLAKCCLLSAAVVPDWSGTHIEVSHSLFVEPKLLLLWSFPPSSPQQAWFSGILWQASDKFLSPRGSLPRTAMQNTPCHFPTAHRGDSLLHPPLTRSKCHLQHLVYNT